MAAISRYAVLTAGEILFSITGLEFAFTQAPASMKALLQSAWLLTVAVGSLVVIIVAESKLVDDQVTEFVLFAAMQGTVTLIFAFMAFWYVRARRADKKEPPMPRHDEEGASLLSGTTLEG